MTECNKSVYLANKSIDMIDAVNKGYTDGYNKAIDDFVNACKEDILCQTFGLNVNGIEMIAEQLKEGVNK